MRSIGLRLAETLKLKRSVGEQHLAFNKFPWQQMVDTVIWLQDGGFV
jgi:hypothetical protein